MDKIRLRRLPVDDIEDFYFAVHDALDALGVAVGEPFTLTARRSYDPGEIDANQAVRGTHTASIAAAERIFPRSGTKRRQVIEALLSGPATRDELIERTRMNPNTLRPRVLEAIDGGWIRQCRKKPMRDGNEVLELTDEGCNELRSYS